MKFADYTKCLAVTSSKQTQIQASWSNWQSLLLFGLLNYMQFTAKHFVFYAEQTVYHKELNLAVLSQRTVYQ